MFWMSWVHHGWTRVIGTERRERRDLLKAQPCFVTEKVLHILLQLSIQLPDINSYRTGLLTSPAANAASGQMKGADQMKDHRIR